MNYIITIDYTDYFLQGDKDLGTICRALSKLQKIKRDYESADDEKILTPVSVQFKQTTLSVVKTRKKKETDYIDPEILPRRVEDSDMFGPLHMRPGPSKSLPGKSTNGRPGRRAIGRAT